jgi:limonene-1,2-epoxide hydrolase
MSASIMPQNGPGPIPAISMTLTPANGPIAFPPRHGVCASLASPQTRESRVCLRKPDREPVMSEESNIAVVKRLCEHWPWLTREEFHKLLAPRCDYRNIPIKGDQHIGPDDAHDMLSRMRERWDIRLEVLNLTANGDVVLTERLEHFKDKKGEREPCELPVMGAFELENGKIIAWRDYFELSHAKALMG